MSTPQDKTVVTSENLRTLEYVPETGTSYEVAPGVFRYLKARTYGVQREFDAELAKEKPTEFDPAAEGYPEPIRISCMEICTTGDDFDREELDLDVVYRLCADFFSLRVPKLKPQSNS